VRAAIYSRVSTTEPEQERALAAAMLRLEEAVKARGWTLAAKNQDSISGKKSDRPGWVATRDLVRRREVDVVVGTRIDRFARSVKELVLFSHDAKSNNVAIVFLDQPIDTTTPVGSFMFTILAALAELERDNIADRVRNGMSWAKKRGVRIGRPPRDRSVVDRARALRDAGLTLRQIRAQLASEGGRPPGIGWLSEELTRSRSESQGP